MKKYLYIALAAAALTSCSSDDTLDVIQGEEIAFNNGFIDNASRAIDKSMTNTTLTSFNVYGTLKGSTTTLVSIFAHDEVTGTVGSTNIWNTTTKQYWIADAIYNFAALVNVDKSKVTCTDGLPTSVSYTYDSSDEKDLLYARSASDIKGKASGNTAVPLTFDHMLSKVGFKINNNNVAGTGYQYEVEDIKITSNLADEGTVAIGQSNGTNTYSWTASGTLANLTFGHAVASTEISESATASRISDDNKVAYSLYERLLIPQTTSGKLTVSFTLKTYVTDANKNVQHVKTETITKSTSAAVTFEPKTYYLINIGLSVGEAITFSVEEAPGWGTANESVTVQ